MLGLAHVLLEEGRCDDDFLNTYCVGWPELRAYLVGEEDGVARTAAWAAAITGISATDIRELAREMASSRTFISTTWSLQRADHG